MKNIKKYIITALLCIIFSIAVTNIIAYASTITYADVVDELTNNQKTTLYNVELNAPFSKDLSGVRETINPETGQLTVGYNLFSLKQNGENATVDISLVYSNIYSSVKNETVEYISSAYQNSLGDKDNFEKSISSVGIGWNIYMPYVEKQNETNKSVVYVHMPDGSVYKQNSSSASGLDNYWLSDVVFSDIGVSVDNVSVKYSLLYKNGDSYYFNDSGYLILKSDKYGNKTNYVWSQDQVPVLTSVYDNCQNTVNFTYADKLVTVVCNNLSYDITREKTDDSYILKSIRDFGGRITEFEYQPEQLKFNFNMYNVDAHSQNTYYLLTGIKYSTGLVSKYDYSISKKWLYEQMDGYIEYSKVSSRYDLDETGKVEEKRYSYSSEPDGYPLYKSGNLPYDYTYSATETNSDGSGVMYVYDKDHDQIKTIQTVDGKIKVEQIRRYDKQTRMPTMFTTNTYDDGGNSRAVYVETSFDGSGNVTKTSTYTNPENKGQNVREYKYSDKYNLCIYDSYMQNENKKVEYKRTIAPNGFGFASETVFENGSAVKTDTYTYYSNGNIESSKIQTSDTDFAITKYLYDSKYSGKYPTTVTVSGVKNADGSFESYSNHFEYDIYGNVTKETNNDGNVKSYEYDKLNRVVKEILEDKCAREYIYNDTENTISTMDANGKKLLYSYGKYGMIKEIKDLDNKNILLKREYDNQKRLLRQTDANGTYVVYSYDKLSRYVSVVVYSNDSKVVSEKYISYDDAFEDAGNIYLQMTVTDGNAEENRITEYLFDYKENVVSQKLLGDNEDRIYSYNYDYVGNNILQVLPSGLTTTMEYNIFGNLTHIVYPDESENFFEYDFNGNCITETNGFGETIEYTFDSLSRQIAMRTFDGNGYNTAKTYYDSRGNITEQYDAKGNKTAYEYNSRGFLTAVRQYSSKDDGIITEYEYDGEGNITKTSYGGIIDGKRHHYVNELDKYGRVVKAIDNMGQATLYEYDAVGNVVKKTDCNGVVSTFEYDALGNVLSYQNSKNGKVCYEYNIFGQPVNIYDGENNKKISYNKFGETVKTINNFITDTYEYDIDGNVIKHIADDKDMGTCETAYTYTLGQLSLISTPIGTEYITYDNAGRIQNKQNSVTGLSKIYTYYPNSNIKQIKTHKDNNLIYVENYEYDANGNKTYSNQNGNIQKYSYDGMNRLTGVVENDNIYTQYEFDIFNNISKEYTVTPTSILKKSYYYDNNNRLLLQDGKQVVRYEYDNMGNMIKRITGIGNLAETEYFTYDGDNKLSTYVSDNTTAEYQYNLDGYRSEKTVNGIKTRYIYDSANISGEITEDNIYSYYRGTELMGYTSNKGDRYYYRQNAHGDVTGILDSIGNEVKSYNYDAYGKQSTFTINPMGDQTILYQWRAEVEQIHNPFRYAGEYTDSETGFTYLRARMYDPNTGRFISEDPYWNVSNMIYGDANYDFDKAKIPDISAITQSTNLYTYCMNNPINYIDYIGLNAIIITNEYGVASADYIKVGNGYFGHMAVVVQDENSKWTYFSYGQDYVKEIIVPNWAMNNLDNFNYWLSSYSGDYTKATYIKGDFTESYKFFSDYVKSNSGNPEYNPFTNNCSQVVVEGIKKGFLNDKTSVDDFIKKSISIIPNKAAKQLANIFHNSEFTYEKSHKIINDELWEAVNGKLYNRNKKKANELKKLW